MEGAALEDRLTQIDYDTNQDKSGDPGEVVLKDFDNLNEAGETKHEDGN